MKIVLLHGFFRDARDLRVMAADLSRDWECVRVNLPTTFAKLETTLAELERQLAPHVNNGAEMVFVAHSMGGLLARIHLARHRELNVTKLIELGTPHFGSHLADIGCAIPGLSRLLPPLTELAERRRQTLLPVPPGIRVGAIVGSANRIWLGKIFLSHTSDGLVEMRSAAPPDADELIVLPLHHNQLQGHADSRAAVRRFITGGSF